MFKNFQIKIFIVELSYGQKKIAGFGGKDCELNDVCEENLCQNDGLCQTVGKDKYKCTCPSQFVGDNCEYSKFI